MAILKNGSTGSEVKKLQTALNKAGTKPPLKVDGIFDKLTDKATRAAQKKFGLTANGKAGETTFAVLKYGGALPEMKVQDYAERTEYARVAWEITYEHIHVLQKLQSEIASLNAIWSKNIAERNLEQEYSRSRPPDRRAL